MRNQTTISRRLLILFICCLCFHCASAQTENENSGDYVYPQKETPQGMDNYLFSTYYHSAAKVYNLRNLQLSSTGKAVLSLKINPSGTSFLVLSSKGKKTQATVHDLWKADEVLYKFSDVENPSAICYTPDARKIIIAAGNELLFFNARTFEPIDKMQVPFETNKLEVSGNGYYLAASGDNRLIVWNLEQKTIRKEFDLGTAVNDMAFSDDNKTFAVLTADGLLSTYDTGTFFVLQSFDALGDSKSCSFHPDGKYVSVVTGDSRISLLNLFDDTERRYVDNEQGGISDARFLRDGKKRIYLTYNTAGSITYDLVSTLTPNYTKLLADELNERMNDWMKMMPGETLEEYNLRVNEETRAKQARLFEQEIATRMADNLVQMSEVSLGKYNLETKMLAVNFNTMPTIYLTVPSGEVSDFMDPGQLEFRNAVYGLTRQDKFELIYAEVYNKVSGKTYIFDNLDRQSLEYLRSDESFVPLELVQQSNMEEMRLQEIKENIVNLAMSQNKISNHTNISVNSSIVSDLDADGKKIMNYKINFAYVVEEGYSAQEDFAPGKYMPDQSPAAQSMLTIIKTAFEEDFASYLKPGKKVRISINGMADALPIHGRIAYDGAYGDFIAEPVYKNGDLGNITVTASEGITENEQLAFLRAMGVKDYIGKNIPALPEMNTDYRNHIEVTSGEGGEFRRITVEFLFIDAF